MMWTVLATSDGTGGLEVDIRGSSHMHTRITKERIFVKGPVRRRAPPSHSVVFSLSHSVSR